MDHAIQCELCKSWEHIACIREVDRPSDGLYAMLCEVQCNALWAVCSVCRGKGSIVKKVYDLETRILLMDQQLQISKLLLEERQRLVEQLQKELLEVKTDRDRLSQLLDEQRAEYLHLIEVKTTEPTVTGATSQPSQLQRPHPPILDLMHLP